MHHQHLVGLGDARDRREQLFRIVVRRLRQNRDQHQDAGVAHEQRVAVRLGAARGLGGDDAAGAAAVLDDHVLMQGGLQPLRGDAREQIGRAAWSLRHDDPDELVGIGLGCGRAGRQAAR